MFVVVADRAPVQKMTSLTMAPKPLLNFWSAAGEILDVDAHVGSRRARREHAEGQKATSHKRRNSPRTWARSRMASHHPAQRAPASRWAGAGQPGSDAALHFRKFDPQCWLYAAGWPRYVDANSRYASRLARSLTRCLSGRRQSSSKALAPRI